MRSELNTVLIEVNHESWSREIEGTGSFDSITVHGPRACLEMTHSTNALANNTVCNHWTIWSHAYAC